MIKRDQLIHGQYYTGRCRNASIARWNANAGVFVYRRYKFGDTFIEEIEHPEDYRGFDVFIPEEIAEIIDKEIPL